MDIKNNNFKVFTYCRVGRKEQLNNVENQEINKLYKNCKINIVAIIKLMQGDEFNIKRDKITKKDYSYKVILNSKKQLETLIQELKRNKVNMAVIEFIDGKLKNNINIINIINKFSEGNIKCLDLASGENNYVPDIFAEKSNCIYK